MKIVYVASGIAVPGAYGGSTHTHEVAQGLADRGHEVHVVAHHPQRQLATLFKPDHTKSGPVDFHYIDLPKALSLLATPHIDRLVRRVQPDALIERYYNLAGAGMIAAARHHVPSLLEVNALIVDPPAVRKRRIDDRLGRPLQRWAIAQCRMADRIVTPLHTTVPRQIERTKIVELPWGANVDRFCRNQSSSTIHALRAQLGIGSDRAVVAFVGSFRAWHGVTDFITAALHLIRAGEPIHCLLIGEGPQRAAAEAAVATHRDRFTFAGSIDHNDVPRYLAVADVGVAPFNTAPHPALRAAGFFWSPLKIYEYMAMSLPVVTANIPPLDTTIREGVEGALFREGDTRDLAAAIARVLHSPDRIEMGERARQRVVAHFSWARHCEHLEQTLHQMIAARHVC